MKFKVGDVVRVVRSPFSNGSLVGLIGTVIEEHKIGFRVDLGPGLKYPNYVFFEEEIVLANWTDKPLLSVTEHELVRKLGECATEFAKLMPTTAWAQDQREFTHHIHALQNMVLARAAARYYPDKYRL